MTKLIGAAMVRNEADIIEAFVRHNLTVLDGLAIVDHGSFDGTSEILAALAAEGLPVMVVRDDSTAHFQDEITTRLVRDVLARTPADFVFVIDADEFLKAPSRPLLDRVLRGLPPGMHAVMDWHTYVPDFAVPDPAPDIRARIAGAKRLARERHGLYKVVVAREFARTPAAWIARGNHLVVPSLDDSGPRRSNPHARLAPEVVALAHVPVRSRDQFFAKIAIGWLAVLATHVPSAAAAFHWREAFEDIVAGKPLTPERLTAIAANYSVPEALRQAAETIARVDDPFLADIELRYAHLGRSDPLPLVLAFAAKLAADGGIPARTTGIAG
jgi:hypothetical protein